MIHRSNNKKCIQKIIKRIFDVSASVLLLVVLAPIMLLVGILVRTTMGKPVLFRQQRSGYKSRPFNIVKFRTMIDPVPGENWKATDKVRLTQLGKFLRKTSIDELPELTNVLVGDMSLVGPRPLLMEYLPNYSSSQTRRHEVTPGITGLAQIKGRQDLPFSKRLEYDLWYVDNWNLLLDVKILVKTIGAVACSSGVRFGQNVKDIDDIGLSRSDANRTITKVDQEK